VNTATVIVAASRPTGRAACACAMPTIGYRGAAPHWNTSKRFQRLDRVEGRGDPGEGFA
jgi:hypothetical protein